MTRPARVVIDISALQHNLKRVREYAPRSRVMAIVKADAYGHGVVRVAKALANADAFGVACLEEAEQLRYAGIWQPVLLLEGNYYPAELTRIQQLDLDIVVHHEHQVAMLEQARLPAPVRVWLKVDSGMHRLGFDPGDVAAVWERLSNCPNVVPAVRLMTHFASSNVPADDMTSRQWQLFMQHCGHYGAEISAANSAAVIAWPATHADWVRPGCMLYGVSPMKETTAAEHGLKPVMTLASQLISVKSLRKGEPVGYGAVWRCPEDMEIGIVATGYGDGFPRHAASGTPVLINGRRASIIGNASMDMLTVDLRNVPNARIGDPVELWGPNLPIEEVAKHADTIAYELLCGVHKRILFVESNGEE